MYPSCERPCRGAPACRRRARRRCSCCGGSHGLASPANIPGWPCPPSDRRRAHRRSAHAEALHQAHLSLAFSGVTSSSTAVAFAFIVPPARNRLPLAGGLAHRRPFRWLRFISAVFPICVMHLVGRQRQVSALDHAHHFGIARLSRSISSLWNFWTSPIRWPEDGGRFGFRLGLGGLGRLFGDAASCADGSHFFNRPLHLLPWRAAGRRP